MPPGPTGVGGSHVARSQSHRPVLIRNGGALERVTIRAMRGALAATLVAAALLGPGVRPAGALASAWEENPHSSVRLITPYLTAPRDGTV
ncbi:MAG: hypothetical protein ACOC7L_02685, partial [Acidobacteriota bacterium]